MFQCIHFYTNLFAFALLFKLTSMDLKNNTKLYFWSWKCEDDKCVQFKPSFDEEYQSLETCNVLCTGPQIWPKPATFQLLSNAVVSVSVSTIHLHIILAPSKIVEKAVQEAFELMKYDLNKIEESFVAAVDRVAVGMIFTINVTDDKDQHLRIDTNESYTLVIIPKQDNGRFEIKVAINALSFCGARHGLETLSQLLWWDSVRQTLVALEAARVTDAPQFRYRGLLLDTARNYFPVSALIRTIDAMGAVKLNTFHWHASDSQAFPPRPGGAAQGAYGPGAVYTDDDVRAVVRRGRLRGVRVLLEVDAPAHVGRAWQGLAHCVDQQPWSAYCSEPPCGQLDPRNPRVFEQLKRIYTDIIRLTGTNDIFHLGGDKISEGCWEQHFNGSDPLDLWIEFTKTALQTLQNITGRLPELTFLWSSQLSNFVKVDFNEFSENLGFQMRNLNWGYNYESGIRTIVSHENAWDLNSGLGEWHEKSGGALYNSWQRIYEYRPWVQSEVKWIEGGEATVWSRTLNPGSLDARIWPRAAALAERLWSDLPNVATRLVALRLDTLRARFVARGIQAAPLWSLWCTQNPQTCG